MVPTVPSSPSFVGHCGGCEQNPQRPRQEPGGSESDATPIRNQVETERLRNGPPAPRKCAHPGCREAGSEGAGGGDTEAHGHSPAVALGAVLSLTQKLHLNQRSASSRPMWLGEGRSTRLGRGEESRIQWESGQSWRGCSLQERDQARQEPGCLPPQGRARAPSEQPGRNVRAATSHSCVGSH